MTVPVHPIRACITPGDGECLVLGLDNGSQFTRAGQPVSSKCDRALAAAKGDDVVVLKGGLDRDYQAWLRSLGLGTPHVAAYGREEDPAPLARLIAQDPGPVLDRLREIPKKALYLPWYSGEWEQAAAAALGADLFGASVRLSRRHNDKSAFKQLCRDSGLPVAEDCLVDTSPGNPGARAELEEAIGGFRRNHPAVLVRGRVDDTGVSQVFRTTGDDIPILLDKVRESRAGQVLVEPWLDAVASPNDQWAVTRQGEIRHLGMQEQELQDLHHVGSYNRTVPPDYSGTVTDISFKIVEQMKSHGYVGVAGIDYIVTAAGVFPVENNARLNGSSIVKLILGELEGLTGPVRFWKLLKLHTPARTFKHLCRTLGSLLFDGRKKNAVFPYNCDDLPKTGHFAVILTASGRPELTELEYSMGKQLNN